MPDARDLETMKPARGASPGAAALVPALTVLHHPEPSRVGQVARLSPLLAGEAVALSRNEPAFAPPGSARGEPLGDPGVSRTPLRLRARDGGIELERGPGVQDVRLDGATIGDGRLVSADELARGAVLELGGRVVLLLHRLGPPAPPAPPLGLVGQSEALERVRRQILQVADLPVAVLLRGGSGTGKELVARALHEASPRAGRPFVAVNVAAIPGSTAAAELFGHVKGAFTGAVRDHPGWFGSADGGTLFLDEIGEAPQEVQPLLLRALDAGEIQPVGASRTQRVDVRLVAATDADLEGAVERRDFRAPLLHRLAAYQIFLPPLFARRDDLGRLLVHFLRLELEACGEPDRLAAAPPGGEPWLPASIAARACRAPWPGNVRQLRNFVRQLVISSRGAPQATLDPVVERLLGADEPAPPAAGAPAQPAAPATGARRPSELDEAALVAALRRHRWRTGAAAEELGISKTTLYALIDKSSTIRKARDVGAEELRACREACGGDLDLMAERLEVSRRGLQLRLKELGL